MTEKEDSLIESPLAEILRDARRRLGLSQADVAAIVGVCATTYGRFERGHYDESTPRLTVSQRRTVATHLGIDPDRLGVPSRNALPLRDEIVQHLLWQAYYSGDTTIARRAVPDYVVALHEQWGAPTLPFPVLSQGYQMVSTLVRDAGHSQAAWIAADRGVTLAERMAATTAAQQEEICHLSAAGRMRRGRAAMSIADTADAAQKDHWVQAAMRDAQSMVVLAERCRPALHAVLLVEAGKLLAAGGQEVPKQVRTTALTLAQTAAGRDPSGVYLTESGILHALAEITLLRFQAPGAPPVDRREAQEALTQVSLATRSLSGTPARWTPQMRMTQVGLLLAIGDVETAIRTTDLLLSHSPTFTSVLTWTRLQRSLARIPTTQPDRFRLVEAVRNRRVAAQVPPADD